MFFFCLLCISIFLDELPKIVSRIMSYLYGAYLVWSYFFSDTVFFGVWDIEKDEIIARRIAFTAGLMLCVYSFVLNKI